MLPAILGELTTFTIFLHKGTPLVLVHRAKIEKQELVPFFEYTQKT
jgi:hypothetical protein